MTAAKEPSRMEQRLAETDRLGIIALRNDLLAGGAFPRTVEHVIELLTSRTLTIYFYVDQCRKKETDITTLARERDELKTQLAAARVLLKSVPSALNAAFSAGAEEHENGSYRRQEKEMEKVYAMRKAITAALTQEDA